MLKQPSKAVSSILAKIFNYSIKFSVFPYLLKRAIIIPVFKNGDANVMNNYRRNALLSIVCKAFERIIAKQLVDYLENSPLLSMSQFVYRTRRGTESLCIVQVVAQNLHCFGVQSCSSQQGRMVNIA